MLNEEVARQDDMVSRLNKEKKSLEENTQKLTEELQAEEDKVNHLSKVKLKLEQNLDDMEDQLEHEKKVRSDVEKVKRKLETDLKIYTGGCGKSTTESKRIWRETLSSKSYSVFILY